MNARQINQTLWTIAGACSAAALLWLLIALVMPLKTAKQDRAAMTPGAGQPVAASGLPAMSAFEPIFQMPLRQALSDSPPAPQAAVNDTPPAPSDRPPLTLVGTIGRSLAMLRNERGEVELKGVGETARGARVVSIQPSAVEVQYNGRSMVLEKPKQPMPGS